jgi:glycosyltransferase involved in cell wall biosynthesis
MPNSRMTASIIIPCFNARGSIRDALDSVAAQELPHLEVIVVDDGSVDGSAEIIAQEYRSVRLVRTPNQGPSAARNLGTSMATGKFIQYLDADDLLAPGKLEKQVAALEETKADVAYGDWQKLFPGPGGAYEPGPVVSGRIEGPAEIALFTDFWCPPAAYLFRREIVEKVSWNLELPVIQDARFVLDCALAGARFTYTPGIAAQYRVHQSGSVSSRDSIAFVCDCLRNATEVEQWWMGHGGITPERCKALLQVYAYAARASFEKDRPTFDTACAALERLQPGYVPESPWHLSLVSRLAGYRRAESVAVAYRKAKRLVHVS